MELLLTSSGIANTSIHDAVLGLLGKPIEESSALVIPTAIYPFPGGPATHGGNLEGARFPSPDWAESWEYWSSAAQHRRRMLGPGGQETGPARMGRWSSVLVVLDAASGLELLASLPSEKVYLGVSAGSIAATAIPRLP